VGGLSPLKPLLYINYLKMTKRSKTYLNSIAMIDKTKNYTVQEAVELVKKTSNVKFDATVEVAVKTNANPKYNDQMMRGTMILPHGTGKTKKVAVFVSEDNLDEAKKS
jgi:large subunit ribosomal protein L1